MIVLGIDPARATGWCLLGEGVKETGLIRTQSGLQGAIGMHMAQGLNRVIKGRAVDLCVLEAPLSPQITTKTGNKDLYGHEERRAITNMQNTLTTYGIRMCFLATLQAQGVPTFEVAIQTWRSSYYGKGTKPPSNILPKDRTGWWKAKAMEYAGHLKFEISTDDEAEAIGIAHWAQSYSNRPAALGKQLAGPPYL